MMGTAKLEERQAIHARKLREVLVSLGPTFIKASHSFISGATPDRGLQTQSHTHSSSLLLHRFVL